MPCQPSPASGPSELRPRVGLRPTRPQQEAGPRIEPPASPACAAGTMPAATAAADPPLEPPGVWPRRQGLWVGPVATRSGQPLEPQFGVVGLPTPTHPALLPRALGSLAWSAA